MLVSKLHSNLRADEYYNPQIGSLLSFKRPLLSVDVSVCVCVCLSVYPQLWC